MHGEYSFSSKTLGKRLFNFQNDQSGHQFWLLESALRKQASQKWGPQGETVSFYLILHQTQHGKNENREFLSHFYIKWQTSVSSCELFKMKNEQIHVKTCQNNGYIKLAKKCYFLWKKWTVDEKKRVQDTRQEGHFATSATIHSPF